MTGTGSAATGLALPAAAACAGLSVRWLAESLRTAGVAVHAIDCFGDADTRAASRQWFALGGADARIDAACLASVAAALPKAAPLWYCAGFEGSPHLLGALAAERPLVGNGAGVLARAASPAAWLDACAARALAVPETLLEATDVAAPCSGRWLVKQGGSSGGDHVRPWVPDTGWPADGYLQRFIAGASLGICFLADGHGARVIGAVRHLRLQRGLAGPFAQGALVACNSLASGLLEELEAGLGRLVRHWGLVGVNGADVILGRDGRLWWLEVNARLPGSLALASREHAWPSWHWQLAGPARARLAQLRPALDGPAEGGRTSVPLPLPLWARSDSPTTQRARGRAVCAQSLFRAPVAARVPLQPAWPDWMHDRPLPETRIGAGEPFATVTAEGSSAREAILTLRRRMNILAAHPAFSDGGAAAR